MQDYVLCRRVAACVALEGVETDPFQWAVDNQWQIATRPGWDDAYSGAIQAGDPDPGGNEEVITDAMIQTAVRAFLAKTATTPN